MQQQSHIDGVEGNGKKRAKRPLSADGAALVGRLRELAEALNDSAPDGRHLSQEGFARRWLPFSPATWSRLQDDGYTGDTPEMERQCQEAVIRIEAELAARGRLAAHTLLRTSTVRGVMEAMQRAVEARGTPNRLVVYLSPTGGGKTELCRHLAAQHGGRVVEGRESWRASYRASCEDIARAVGWEARIRNARQAEDAMLAALCERPTMLAIDEANSFGAQTCNMAKLILNQTPTALFIAAIPELWSRMESRAWAEAAQLKRRAVAVIRLSALTPADVRPFLAPYIADEKTLARSAARIADMAGDFGLYDLVRRITGRLADLGRDPAEIGEEDVAAAARYTRETFLAMSAGGGRK